MEVGGKLPCISAADDGETPYYTWTQNSIELYVYLPLGDEVRLRDVDVAIEERGLCVSVMGRLMIQGELEAEVSPDECMWEINDDDGDRKLYIVLWKSYRDRWTHMFNASV